MSNAKILLSLLRPYKSKVVLTFVAILIANLLGLIFPWAIKLIIDKILPLKDLFLLNIVVIGLLVVFVLKFVFGFSREYLAFVIGENVVCDLRNKLYWHLNRLSVKYIENTPKGKIISGIIGDVESIRKFLFGGMLDFVYSFFNVFFVLSVLLVLDWKLTLVSLIYLPFFGITFSKFVPRLKNKHRLVRDKYAELTTGLNEVLNGIRVVTGFAKNKQETDKFNKKQKEIFDASLHSHRLEIILWMSSEFFSSLGLITLIWFGSREVFAGRITTGTLMAFYSYLGMLFYPVVRMAIINNYYQEAAVSLERIQEVLSQAPAIQEKKYPVFLDKVNGPIRFADVSFSYDNKREVLSGIDFEAQDSQLVALVGRSGAGKTTLMNLLLRFYDPTKGDIFIGKYNLKDLDLKSYRSKIAMVLQDDYLFRATIRDNIAYSRPNACEAEIINAAKLANAHEFIIDLPSGYDTHIGERGTKLSYGQRQRISIARAIIRNPSILILDEPTSAIDSETESLIVEDAFKNLMQGRISFLITHRLSMVSHAHKIIFIEDGRIVESGTHSQLLNREGAYRSMWMKYGHALGSSDDIIREIGSRAS